MAIFNSYVSHYQRVILQHFGPNKKPQPVATLEDSRLLCRRDGAEICLGSMSLEVLVRFFIPLTSDGWWFQPIHPISILVIEDHHPKNG